MKLNKITYTGLAAVLLVLCSFCAQAQSERKYVREGNELFNNAMADTTKVDTIGFSNAEVEYRKALAERPDDLNWQFNLGDALYKQGNFSDAKEIFQAVAVADTNRVARAKAYHNLGNCFLIEKKLDESIDAYKNALRNNPNDPETKYNLLYAMELKKQKEEQEQKKQKDEADPEEGQEKDNKNKDKDKDQKTQSEKSKEEQEQDNKDSQDKKEDQDQDDKEGKEKQKQSGEEQSEEISEKDAEKLLQALENDEKKTQDKVKKAQANKGKVLKTDKDW